SILRGWERETTSGEAAKEPTSKYGPGKPPLRLTEKSVLIIDECSMVGTRELAKLVEAVAEANAKIILIGDRKQLQSISAGREVAEVNAAIQEVRIRAGQLGAESLRMGGTDIHVGDRVMTTKTSKYHNCDNGDLGTVTAIDLKRRTVTIKFDGEGNRRATIS